MPTNFKQIYARIKTEMDQLAKKGYIVPKTSGIYIFRRVDTETQKKYCYIGQAKNLYNRIATHIISYDQRIDKSIKKRGILNKLNPFDGEWLLEWTECPIYTLNENERYYIIHYVDELKYEPYNITGGGQDKGKVDIQPRKKQFTYKHGCEVGYQKAIDEIKELFKYLKADVNQFKKNGDATELAKKKLEQFTNDFLKDK